jgi:hypothetical protein
MFTLPRSAIGIEINFSRCPYVGGGGKTEGGLVADDIVGEAVQPNISMSFIERVEPFGVQFSNGTTPVNEPGSKGPRVCEPFVGSITNMPPLQVSG